MAPDGSEADDFLGIHQDDSSVICGIDKDLLQIPGKHYNYDKKVSQVVTPLEGWRNFFTQVLTGDASDNIPGLPRIGPVKAMSILSMAASPKEMYQTVRDVYDEHMLSHRFSEVCALMYLLRDFDDSWEYQEEWFNSGGYNE